MIGLRPERKLIGLALRGLKTAVTMSGPVETSIRTKISSKLSPVHFDVINESYMHNVPKGAESHFKVVVISSLFENQPLIQRHRMVNELLSEEFANGLHALSIVAKTPSQWADSNKKLFHSDAVMDLHLSTNEQSEISVACGGDTPKSPFIVSKIERLFSRGALAQGFYSPSKKLFPKERIEGKVEFLSESLPEVVPVDENTIPDSSVTLENKSVSVQTSETLVLKNENKNIDLPSDAVDACLKVMKTSIPIALNSDEKENNLDSKEYKGTTVEPESQEIKDGNYFLKILDERIKILELIAVDCESFIHMCDIEESKGELRSVAGNARLLIAEKFNQFRGLCNKNISQSKLDTYPTTNQDLEGFWDMVSIQFDDINTKYETIKTMRDNGWISPTAKSGTKVKPAKKTCRPLRTLQPIKQPHIDKQADNLKARDATRKKMLEERRLAMKPSNAPFK